jgi:hypothetical protein
MLLTRLAMAAAEARSGLPETLRCAALGRPLPIEALRGAPFAVRLVPAAPGTVPWTVEWRRCGADCFTGELLLDTSRLAGATAPFLKLVAGGSGSGRTRACGVWEDDGNRLTGDEMLEVPLRR